jgi:hypothetical protein
MEIARLTIALEEVEPPVRRTLEVPLGLRLDRLHRVIQAAMGWQECHLYEFTAGRRRWCIPDEDDEADDGNRHAARTTLAQYLADAGPAPLRYVYDFGDDWVHRLTVETAAAEAGALYPRLTEVTGRCPPEDVGGAPGYEHFLAALADPSHPDHDDLKDWAGGGFDPGAPDPEALRAAVGRLAATWRPRRG